jgi:CBS domain-containing protein
VERTQTMTTRTAAENLTVAEVMLSRPKTLSASATVADVRRLFANETMRTVLVVDGDAFVGTLERPDLPDAAGDGEPVRAYAVAEAERVTPGLRVAEAMSVVEASREGRVVVVDEDGATLRGMLCLRRMYDAFCTDG